MPVRTKRLGARDTSPENVIVVVYTCPAGETAIIKDIRIDVKSGSPSRVVALLTSGPLDVSLIDKPMGPNDVASTQGFVVLQPGDQLRALSVGGVCRVWVSGAELEGLAD